MKKLALALITIGATVTSQAADLKNVFEQALANDPQLAAEVALANANGQSAGLARQAVLPTITLNAEISEKDLDGTPTNPLTSLNSDGTTEKTSYDVTLSQTLIAPASWYSYYVRQSRA
jgi:outer membrane protein